ncbi:MAG: 50S ribosomal protein L19e [Candidatus Woesearchaeota archaeon]|jgi:large subunit ribosomal protein L19e|nr:50S ribosomal protein L19e [Candidatus Woesearchaeota archaeon]
MVDLGKQKNLAARALGVSKQRVKFVGDSAEAKKSLKELISREDVKALIEEKIIKKLPKKGNSRTNANKIIIQRAKGRRSGQGSRKGTANARFNTKDKWIIKIRALRSMLTKLKEDGKLDVKTYRNLYRKSKGNFFRNKRHLALYLEQNNLLLEVENGKK